jgi:hypothetical protein
MAALTGPRNTKAKASFSPLAFPQKGSTVLYTGALAALDAGYLAPGRTATGLTGAGRVKKTSVNAGGADGAVTAEVESGIFRWANGDAIVQADVGKLAYIVDDQTVSKGATGKSIAGLILEVDSLGVWVATDQATMMASAIAGTSASIGVDERSRKEKT